MPGSPALTAPVASRAVAGNVREGLAGAATALAPYARMLAGNDHDAADLIQDTLVRALERSASFDGRSSLVTWLRRIMHNIWVDRTRATREHPSDEVADLVEARWRDDDYTVDAAQVVARAEAPFAYVFRQAAHVVDADVLEHAVEPRLEAAA